MAKSKIIITGREVIKTIIFVLLFACQVIGGNDCFTIVVGRDASADGHMLMAHNEDDSPPQVVHHRKIPRMQYGPGNTVTLVNGGQLDQVGETWAYFWAEMPEMTFSDSYLNEWGVCIASDACRSREDNPELTDGGISYMLRKLVAQRATSAREGVILAGQLVEQFGYNSSGRTYTICDPNEGWLFCAINGKHWLARRIPDNEVTIIANTYTVHEVDLSDTANFLASADIIDYAISRGWYHPETDGAFDFAAAYANPGIASDSANFCRQWGGLRLIAADPLLLDQQLPFSVKPNKKIGVADVMQILRDHYEDTDLFAVDPESGDPHRTGTRTICTWTTQTSFIAQLRHDMPADIGLVYWVCLGPPCTSFYIPYYFGMADFPSGYSSEETRPSEEYFEANISAPFEADSQRAFWTFSNFNHKACADYEKTLPRLLAGREIIEGRTLELKGPLERTVRETFPLNKRVALKLLTDFSTELYLSTLKLMDDLAVDK